MAYDERLGGRVRDVMAPAGDVGERKMFGGLTFMLNGNMCCGIVGDSLMLRLDPERADEALAQPHVRPMDFTGRPMKGFVAATRTSRDVEPTKGVDSTAGPSPRTSQYAVIRLNAAAATRMK